MIFGISDKIKMSELKCQIEDLKKENVKLKFANDAYQKRLVGEMETASVAIDWDAMKVFSVERMWENGLPKTVLGYMLSEPVITTEGENEQRVTYKDIVREWTLYCSATKHEELVKEFNAWKEKKK
jgi:regulator of replication initiation timing